MKVELKAIHKSFGTVHANNNINLAIQAGTIQGILGENGAGKSTLMKVLSGFIQEDEGKILLDGKPISVRSPADAIQHGIGMLHQDPLDFPPMRIIDNFIVGREGGVFPNKKEARKDFIKLANEFDFALDPESYVDSLTVGERQQLEILRLLWLGVRVLILDEPTTGISALQKEKLFATLKTLAKQGKTIIFVSHKLEDVEQLCNQVAVLRQGILVGEADAPFEIDKLVEMMFSKVISVEAKQPCPFGNSALSLHNFVVEDYRLRLESVDLTLRAGEVIGLAGMEGSGQRPFLRACAGLLRPTQGKVIVGEKDLTGKPYLAYKNHGVGFLPASRLEEGLIPGLSLTEHFILAEKGQGMFIDRERWERETKERITSFNIRGTPLSPVEALSGGNQQRALLALLNSPLSLILLEHPTRGLDIESVIYIWGKLKERCRQGTAIIFVSADLEEILQYSDRVLVFFSGRVSPPLDASATSVEQLGQLIGGKGWAEKFEQQGDVYA
ncbi:MAG: ATP-binding cassette domain-containing protein [Anaerolineales bacterium]|nr:ATP-binding cassette domain-containing protein [Anaerolineales bacterium]